MKSAKYLEQQNVQRTRNYYKTNAVIATTITMMNDEVDVPLDIVSLPVIMFDLLL